MLSTEIIGEDAGSIDMHRGGEGAKLESVHKASSGVKQRAASTFTTGTTTTFLPLAHPAATSSRCMPAP